MPALTSQRLSITGPLLRFGLLAVLALILGGMILADPELHTVAVRGGDLAVTLPVSVEGWHVKPSTGNLLLSAETRLSLATLEIVDTELPAQSDLRAFTAQRVSLGRVHARDLFVWEEGPERYGSNTYHAVKWTASERLGPLPLKVSYWTLDHYVAHKGTYLRMTLRYPHFMWRYFRPDRILIGGSLMLEGPMP